MIFALNYRSAQVINKEYFKNLNVKKAFKLHLASLHEILVILDSNNKITTYPLELQKDLKEDFEKFSLSFNIVEPKEKEINGFEIKGFGFDQQQGSVETVWQIQFAN